MGKVRRTDALGRWVVEKRRTGVEGGDLLAEDRAGLSTLLRTGRLWHYYYVMWRKWMREESVGRQAVRFVSTVHAEGQAGGVRESRKYFI